MPGLIKTSFIFLALSFRLLGQSQPDLVDFLQREFKSMENEQVEVKDIKFSDNDSTCRITSSAPGQLSEQTLEFALADVDIYTRQTLQKGPKEDFVYTYALVVAPRGRNGQLRKNMSKAVAPEVILRSTYNGSKIRSMEWAFARLTELTTGRTTWVQFRGVPQTP